MVDPLHWKPIFRYLGAAAYHQRRPKARTLLGLSIVYRPLSISLYEALQ